jgi:hypothetical protein
VAAHAVAREGAAGGVERQGGFEHRRQLVHDVGLHAEVPAPGRLGGVEVEAGPLAEVVLGHVGHRLPVAIGAAGGRVGGHHRHPQHE